MIENREEGSRALETIVDALRGGLNACEDPNLDLVGDGWKVDPLDDRAVRYVRFSGRQFQITVEAVD